MTQKWWLTRRRMLRIGITGIGLLGIGVPQAASAQTITAQYYQVDFVAGEPIESLGDSNDAFYGRQNRLIQYLHGDRDGERKRDMWLNSLDPETRRCVTADPIQVDGATASIEFQVADGCERTFSLVAYTLPDGTFSFGDEQQFIDAETETFAAGTHRLEVALPPVPTEPTVVDPTVTGVEPFGDTVALQESTLFVEGPPVDRRGTVQVFTEDGSGWTQSQTLVGSSTAPSDRFGWDIAADDGTAFVGAPQDTNERGVSAGAVYVFERDSESGTWEQSQKLLPDEDITLGGLFGLVVNVDGITGLVTGGSGGSTGMAYVYEKNVNTWEETAKLAPTTPRPGFGRSSSVSGTTAVVGATYTTLDPEGRLGEVYVFDGSMGWEQTARLRPESRSSEIEFAESVAIDGNRIAVGAPEDNPPGAVYIFDRIDEQWEQTEKITVSNTDPVSDFGYELDLREDKLLVGGDYGENVYLLEWHNEQWIQRAKFVRAQGDDEFDLPSLDLSDSRGAIGTAHYDGDRGAVYIVDIE